MKLCFCVEDIFLYISGLCMEINSLSRLSAYNETWRGCFTNLMHLGLLSREFSTDVNLSPVGLVHLDVIYIIVLKIVIFSLRQSPETLFWRYRYLTF